MGDKDAPVSDVGDWEQKEGMKGWGGVLLQKGRKLSEIGPKAWALTWGIGPESARKVLRDITDSVFK